MEGKTADAIARGEEPPWDGIYAPEETHHYLQRKIPDAIARGRNLLMVVFMLHHQTRLLLIHQLQNLPRKLNLRHHVAGMDEVTPVLFLQY
jgi:hypothetical protein